MSRIAVPILSLLFFIFFAIVSGSATTVTIGEMFSETEVTTSIMINDVTDVATVGVKVTYDPSVIAVTDVSNYFPHPVSNIDAEEGWVKIGGFKEGEGRNGNVKLADLTIAPQGSYGGYSDLDITVESLSDRDYKPIDADVIDGFFYIADSTYIARWIAGIEGYEVKEGAADVSGDGIVDVYDCVYLARHAACISGYEELH